MTESPSWVAIDTNVFARLRAIDVECSLTSLLVQAHGEIGVGDHQQLAMMDYCQCVRDDLQDHGVTDESTIEFMLAYQGQYSLPRIAKDPVDLKLVVFVKQAERATLVTCDRRLLGLCEEQALKHLCFKAAMNNVHQAVGGLFNDPDYNTAAMFDASPAQVDPFFHYHHNTKCAACDSRNTCPTRKSLPSTT